MGNIQVSYLLLRYSHVVRFHFWLRNVDPDLVRAAAVRSEELSLQTFASLLDRSVTDLPPRVPPLAALPPKLGSNALSSATSLRLTAFIPAGAVVIRFSFCLHAFGIQAHRIRLACG